MSVYSAQQSTDSQPPEAIWVAKSDNAKTLATILQTIVFKPEDSKKKDSVNITVEFNEEGMKFIVEHGKEYQASVFFQSSFFKTYNYDRNTRDFYRFKLNLSMLLDCLNIFGSYPGHDRLVPIQFFYWDTPTPFNMILEDSGVNTTCQFKIMDTESPEFFNLDDIQNNNVVISSEHLLDAFGTLDFKSPEIRIKLGLNEGPDKDLLILSSTSSESTFISTCKQKLFDFCDCKYDLEFNYALSHIQPCVKALATAKSTRVTVGVNGLLRFQNTFVHDEKRLVVEYFITARQHDNYFTDHHMMG
ncbi:exonuclease [Cavenderia fasciculata]|uniref:Exonuclease n=1 Tax=Cavenderia fasciculata TaxID=261658 RepID=F4PJV9_CACFS|nr:exonuclease [Cavenderia fasciculata]EGG23883.1 exonuclease [Cavenderia fasciculata]|eukprot:XP_004361734.1 exonuclease [Cavenderia fasciculata]